MVVVMEERATEEQVQRVVAQLVEMGYDVHRSTGATRTVVGAVGGSRKGDPRLLEVLASRGVVPGPEHIVESHASPREALASAQERMGENDRIVVFGSFLTVGDVVAGRRSPGRPH